MIIKNTFKILFRSIEATIKSFLYRLLVVSLILLLGITILVPVVEELFASNFFSSIYSLFAGGIFALNGEVITDSFNEIMNVLNNLLVNNISFTWSSIMLLCLLVIVFPICLGFVKTTECQILFGSLSSNSNFGFMTCFFENFKDSFKFRAYRLLFSVPICILGGAFVCLVTFVLSQFLGPILSALIILIGLTILITAFTTFFLIYEPNLIIKKLLPWQALKDSVKNVQKYGFFKLFSILFLYNIVVIIINTMLCVYTYGIALLFTLPLTLQFSNVLRMVLCYECLGMDYYLDDKNVVITKKSYEKNSIESMKDVL